MQRVALSVRRSQKKRQRMKRKSIYALSLSFFEINMAYRSSNFFLRWILKATRKIFTWNEQKKKLRERGNLWTADTHSITLFSHKNVFSYIFFPFSLHYIFIVSQNARNFDFSSVRRRKRLLCIERCRCMITKIPVYIFFECYSASLINLGTYLHTIFRNKVRKICATQECSQNQ